MKKIFLVVALPICISGRAQTYYPIPDSNAVWSIITGTYDQGNNTWLLGTFHLSIIGDTLIKGKQYHKLYSSGDSSFNPLNAVYECAFREDTTRKIYYVHKNDSTEKKLYDFSLGIGDTLLKVNNSQLTINRDNLPSGMYFYKVMDGMKVLATGKVIIQ